MFHLSAKQRVLKNFSLIVLTYVLVFGAVNTNAGVQPIFNQANNLGTISQMLLFLRKKPRKVCVRIREKKQNSDPDLLSGISHT